MKNNHLWLHLPLIVNQMIPYLGLFFLGNKIGKSCPQRTFNRSNIVTVQVHNMNLALSCEKPRPKMTAFKSFTVLFFILVSTASTYILFLKVFRSINISIYLL